MAYLGKRERLDESGGYGPPQKRSGFGGPPHQGGHGPFQGQNQGGGRKAYDNYPNQYPQSSPNHRGMPPMQDDRPGNVLLFNVLNPKYPITVDVMNTICTNSGAVINRIVIMRKNGIQVMIEFETPEMAENIKEALNGADIYSGCCTLKIEWAKVARLSVSKNDQDNWDYTIGQKIGGQDKLHSLLPIPRDGGGGNVGPMDDYQEDMRRQQIPPPHSQQQPPSHYHHNQPQPSSDYGGHPPAYTDHHGHGGGNGGRPDTGYGGGGAYRANDRYSGGPGGPPPHRGGGPGGPRQEFHPPAYEHHGGGGGGGGAGYPYMGEGDNFRGRGAMGGRGFRGGPFQGRGGGGPRAPYPPMMGGGGGGRGGGGMMDEFADYEDVPGAPMLQQGSVMMVYGLDADRMNCHRVFNLFCLYGNVVRVKFLKSKDGVAMVQMGDYMSCERAANALNGTFLYGKKILIGCSKQAFIQDVPNPQELPDGSPSFQDFMGNRNNRFTTPEAAAKNHILYFFNAPPGLKEEDLVRVFNDAGLKGPRRIKIFPTKTEKSSTGLLEWDSKNDSVEALVICNHTPMPNPIGKNPYILKFCFSDVQIKNTPFGGNFNGGSKSSNTTNTNTTSGGGGGGGGSSGGSNMNNSNSSSSNATNAKEDTGKK